jgi:hypothetical protein
VSGRTPPKNHIPTVIDDPQLASASMDVIVDGFARNTCTVQSLVAARSTAYSEIGVAAASTTRRPCNAVLDGVSDRVNVYVVVLAVVIEAKPEPSEMMPRIVFW